MSQHTFRLVEIGEQRALIRTRGGNLELSHSIDGREDLPEIVALLEVAPDLLDAARGVDTLYAELHAAMPAIVGKPGYDIVQEAVRKARAAIAKAEGRE